MFSSLSPEMLATCIDRAKGLMGDVRMSVFSWPQQWPNSACGFPNGVSMQAFWIAPTVILMDDDDRVCVFHNGRLVAFCVAPSQEFQERARSMNLPGASESDFWIRQGAEKWEPRPDWPAAHHQNQE